MVLNNGNSTGLSDLSPIDQAIRIVRAIRLCEKAGVDPALCKQVKESVLASFAEPEFTELQPKVWKEDSSNYELKIRQLVQLDASWTQISPVAWKFYELKPTSDVAAHMLELAFLHGDEQDVFEVLTKLAANDQKFFAFINKAVRNQLLRLFWNHKIGAHLAKILEWQRNERWLIPTERLFVLTFLKNYRDPEIALQYYEKYPKDIHQAIKLVGPEIGIHPGAIFLQIAHYSVQLGRHAEALSLLNKINISDPEYQEAMNLILTIDSTSRTAEQSDYARRLSQEGNWQTRIELLSSFLVVTRKGVGIRDRNRASLNLLLREPLKWVPREPEAWNQLAKTLVSAIDIIHLVPALMTVFQENSLRFHDRALDVALWQPFVAPPPDIQPDPYWRSIANMHRYIASYGKQEDALWSAKDWMASSAVDQVSTQQIQRLSWTDLLHWTSDWVASSPLLVPDDKQRMQLQISVNGEPSMVSPADIQNYLKFHPRAPYSILTRMESIATCHKLPALELTLVRCRAHLSHYRNQDLAKVFQIARENREYDLAWRTCSVLASRLDLDPSLYSAWQISGENRKNYQILLPVVENIEACLQGFNLNEMKLCKAMIKAGSLIPEILAVTNKEIHSQKVKPAPAGSIELTIDNRLNQIPWMPPLKKIYFLGPKPENFPSLRIPPFAKRVPNNDWSLILLRLIDRLGIGVWNWRISEVVTALNSQLAFKLARTDHKRFSIKSSGFLRNTTLTQRAGLADFRLVGRDISDEDAALCLAKFLCRLTTSMYQNHIQALHSLQNMRAPLPILRDLETWTISPAYGQLRKSVGTVSCVPVPNVIDARTSPLKSKDKIVGTIRPTTTQS
jgi:hypothetical protein